MDHLVNSLVEVGVQVIVMVFGTLLSIVAGKAVSVLNNIKKKDETGIVDAVTDAVVKYAEAELTGVKGAEKREFAIEKAVEILHSKGLKKVTKAEIIAGIEAGVRKLDEGNLLGVGVSIDGIDPDPDPQAKK